MPSDPRPPATATHHPLPFERLSPADFERLCLWLVERQGYDRVEALGEAGSEQGRDVVAWKDGRRVAFQCKRVKQFSPKSAVAEIEKVHRLEEDHPDEYVFLVSCAVSAKTRRAARAAWGDEETCSFWAGTELDHKVKGHPELVHEFFDLGGGDPLPRPSYLDEESEELSGRLKKLFRQRKDLTIAGQDTRLVEGEISTSGDCSGRGHSCGPGNSSRTAATSSSSPSAAAASRRCGKPGRTRPRDWSP